MAFVTSVFFALSSVTYCTSKRKQRLHQLRAFANPFRNQISRTDGQERRVRDAQDVRRERHDRRHVVRELRRAVRVRRAVELDERRHGEARQHRGLRADGVEIPMVQVELLFLEGDGVLPY